jgi:hypothetical protein
VFALPGLHVIENVFETSVYSFFLLLASLGGFMYVNTTV